MLVANRRHGERNRGQGAVLTPTDGFRRSGPSPARIFASTVSSSCCNSWGMSIRMGWPRNCFGRRVAKHPLRGPVPGRDDAGPSLSVTIASSDPSTTGASLPRGRVRPLPVADIPGNSRGPDHTTGLVITMGDTVNEMGRSVPSFHCRIVSMRDGMARSNATQDRVFLALPVGGDDHANGAADGFGGRVAEHPLRGAVPGADGALRDPY